ncbi:MAG: hypothetical protein AB1757_30160 [Acidobacteriota bacterium]
MSKMMTTDFPVSKETEKYKAGIKEMLAEMKRLNKRMERDQKEIERMKIRTNETLARLKAC